MARRSKGEGTIFFSKTEGRWIGEVTLPNGSKKRKRSKNQKKVQDWLISVRASLQQGYLLSGESTTLEAYLNYYIESTASHTLKPSTLRSYKYLIRDHVVPEIGKIKLTEIKAHHLNSLYRKKLDSGLSKRTVQYIHSVIRKALNQAVKWELIIRNPTDLVSPPTPEKEEPVTLTVNQAKMFLDSVDDARWKNMYTLAIMLGMRKGEILGLRWQDVDFEKNMISINNTVYEIQGQIYQGSPKSESSRRTVAMPKDVSAGLKEYQLLTGNSHGLIFTTSTGRPVSQRNLTRHFHSALAKCGLPRIPFHNLRHSFATIAFKEGLHPKIVQETLGHADIHLTLTTYSHVIEGMQKEAATKFDEVFRD